MDEEDFTKGPEVLPVGPRSKIRPTAKPGSTEEKMQVDQFWERVFANGRLHTLPPRSCSLENKYFWGTQYMEGDETSLVNEAKGKNYDTATKAEANRQCTESPVFIAGSVSDDASRVTDVTNVTNFVREAESSGTSDSDVGFEGNEQHSRRQIAHHDSPAKPSTHEHRSTRPMVCTDIDLSLETLTLNSKGLRNMSVVSQHKFLEERKHAFMESPTSAPRAPSDIADIRLAVLRGDLGPELLRIAESVQKDRFDAARKAAESGESPASQEDRNPVSFTVKATENQENIGKPETSCTTLNESNGMNTLSDGDEVPTCPRSPDATYKTPQDLRKEECAIVDAERETVKATQGTGGNTLWPAFNGRLTENDASMDISGLEDACQEAPTCPPSPQLRNAMTFDEPEEDEAVDEVKADEAEDWDPWTPAAESISRGPPRFRSKFQEWDGDEEAAIAFHSSPESSKTFPGCPTRAQIVILKRALSPPRRRSIYPLRRNIVIQKRTKSQAQQSPFKSEERHKDQASEDNRDQQQSADSHEGGGHHTLTDLQKERINQLKHLKFEVQRPIPRRPAPSRPGHAEQQNQYTSPPSSMQEDREQAEDGIGVETQTEDPLGLRGGVSQMWCETIGTKRRRLSVIS